MGSVLLVYIKSYICKDKMSNTIVLAFDIERSGSRVDNETIAIGASVVNSDLKELESLFLTGFFTPDHRTPTIFEKRCWEEFWSKYPDSLKILEYKGDLGKVERQREMCEIFQMFRERWEIYAYDNKVNLEIVADNNVYDGGFINDMICKHTSDLPIPFTASSPQKYRSFWETHSEQRGLLMAVDPSFKKNWGFGERIRELYNVPVMIRSHDHNPANDSYTIAFEQQVLLGVRDGRIRKRV